MFFKNLEEVKYFVFWGTLIFTIEFLFLNIKYWVRLYLRIVFLSDAMCKQPVTNWFWIMGLFYKAVLFQLALYPYSKSP
jgi:hypothetical protein